MSSVAMHSLLNIAPQILKTTASQVNQYELPCPTFAGLIKNGSKFMPNEWTIGRTGDVSCFLAHVSFKSLISIPRCDRAIYLTLKQQQRNRLGLQELNNNGLVFDCEELYERRAGKVKKKTYTTTVEYLGDLLALLFNQEDEDEEEDDEKKEGEDETEAYEDSGPINLAPKKVDEPGNAAKHKVGDSQSKARGKSTSIGVSKNQANNGEENINDEMTSDAEGKSVAAKSKLMKGVAKKGTGKVTKKSTGKRTTGEENGAKNGGSATTFAKTTLSAGIARATFARPIEQRDDIKATSNAKKVSTVNERNLERDIDMDNLRVKKELDDDNAADAEYNMEINGELEMATNGETTTNGEETADASAEFSMNASGEEGELRVDIVSSRVTTLALENGVISHMRPVVTLEPMKDLNEYLEERMSMEGEGNQKPFYVLVEDQKAGEANEIFGEDGRNDSQDEMQMQDEYVDKQMQNEYVDTPYDTNYESIPQGPNAYAHLKLPPDIQERWSKLQREVDGKYSCFMCAYQNTYHCRIKKHLFAHFVDPKQKSSRLKSVSGRQLKCDKCDRVFTKHKELKKHSVVHGKTQSFNCSECSFVFGRQSEVTRHLRVEHGIVAEPRCQECGKMFKSRTSLKQHILKLHRGERPACTYCGRKFYSKYSLNTHMAAHQKVFMATFDHTAERDESGRWKCNKCGRDFKLKNSLKVHAMSHLNIRPFKCSLCQKSFTSASSLKFHEDIHTGIKRFSCKYCGEQFRQASSLKNHIRRHENNFPHVCQYCGKGFNMPRDKDKHEALHVRKVMELQIDPNTGEMAYKEKMEILDQLPTRAAKGGIPPKCHVCEKVLSSHPALRIHMMIHTGEKPYKCESCGQSFNQLANLGRHKRRQVCKEPHHSCDVCGKRFKQAKNLEFHKRTHLPNAKATPRVKLNTRCKVCLKKFASNMGLRGHMKSHKKSAEIEEEAKEHLSSQSPADMGKTTETQHLANLEQIIGNGETAAASD